MTLMDQRTMTPQTVHDDVRELSPTITARAAEIERARRVPRDLLDQLTAAGCFRLLLPRSHHGLETELPTAMRVFEMLARADASVGWTVMIGSGSWCDLAGLPRASFDALFPRDHDVIVAGAFNPTGSIEALDGAYRVSGRWSFASGCEHATWIFGNCVEGVVDGVPQLRIAVFSPDQVVIEDTWHVSGLAGTGSHHFHVDGVVVPANRTVAPLADEPCLDEPILRIPPAPAFSLGIASVAVGIAQGALDDITALATGKVPLLAPAPLAANPLFQSELATADTALRAARALLYETADSTWAGAVGRSPLELTTRARIRATAVWVTEQAAAVVDMAYRAGGGSSIYMDCALQRRFRDIHALAQHFLVRRDTMTTAGAILAGQDVEIMVF
jgi:alkylation response protein AidB-like acyl-CoA dehydrogenase